MIKKLLAVLFAGFLLVGFGNALAAGAAKQKLTLQLSWVIQTQAAGYYVALDKGWYAEEGIDLAIDPSGPGINKVQRLATGKADILVIWLPDALRARAAGVPLVQIGQLTQSAGMVLISFKKLGIDTPAKLKGQKVGVWFGNGDPPVLALLAKYGINPKRDVVLVGQGFSMEPFLEGKLPVASATIPNELIVVLQSGVKREDLNIIDPNQYGVFLSEDGWYVTQRTLRQRPDVLARWMAATIRGQQWALANPEEATRITMKYVPKGQPADYNHLYAQMLAYRRLICTAPAGIQLRPIGYVDPKVFDHNVKLMRDHAGLTKQIGKEAYTNAIWEKANQIMKQKGTNPNCVKY